MDTDLLESILVGVKAEQHQQEPRKARPQPEQSLKCPRCDSPNTKFCYYNNYSLSQPRYFCKSCRRYWTKGGTLRNIPVGGGCRKKKRVSSTKRKQDPHLGGLVNSLDLSNHALSFRSFQKQDPTDDDYNNNNNNRLHHFGSNNHVLDTGEYSARNDIEIPSLGLLDSITRGPFENDGMNPGGNFYSGEGDYDHVAAMKRELSSGENLMLLGFPWQVNVNGNGTSGSLSPSSSSLVSWNGGLSSSSWHHGLLNTTN